MKLPIFLLDQDRDRGYQIVSGRFLKLHHAEKTWEEAQRTCRFELANLVTVDSLAINQWIANQGMQLWIGATDKVLAACCIYQHATLDNRSYKNKAK